MSARRWRTGALSLVVVAMVVTTMATLSTSRARVSATTENSSNLFTSGSIDVEVGTRQTLLFEHDGLYPGLVVESCFRVGYEGTLTGPDVRLFGEVTEPGVLDELLEVAVWTGEGDAEGDCDAFVADGDPRYRGTLRGLWAAHPSHAEGMELLTEAEPGDEISVRIRARLVDDERADQAQGTESTFTVVVEAML